MKPTLQSLLSRRILILDGAMGTLLQRLDRRELPYDGWILSRPWDVERVHRSYLEAGADVIETNTFNAQRISLRQYGLESQVEAINFKEAQSCRRLADEYSLKTPDKPRFVVGAIGPTAFTCSFTDEKRKTDARALPFDEFADAYGEQIKALMEGGVDALLIETIYCFENARAAVVAALRTMERLNREIPLMLSFTTPAQKDALAFADEVDSFLQLFPSLTFLAVGLNCSYRAEQMRPFVREFAHRFSSAICAYPCAGLPDADGGYAQSPKQFAEEMKRYVDEGLVNLIGGCCGTTDAYIAELFSSIQTGRGLTVENRSDNQIKKILF